MAHCDVQDKIGNEITNLRDEIKLLQSEVHKLNLQHTNSTSPQIQPPRTRAQQISKLCITSWNCRGIYLPVFHIYIT